MFNMTEIFYDDPASGSQSTCSALPLFLRYGSLIYVYVLCLVSVASPPSPPTSRAWIETFLIRDLRIIYDAPLTTR